MKQGTWGTLALGLMLAPLCQAGFGDAVGPQATIWQAPSPDPETAFTLAAGRDGSSIAIWQGEWNGLSVLMSQRFAVDGQPVGAAQPLNFPPFPGDSVHTPAVAIAADGVATVVWQQRSTGDDGEILAARVGADGLLLGAPFTINPDPAGEQSLPAVAADSLNHVLITWTGPADAGYGVYGRLLNGWGGFQFDAVRVDEAAQPQPVASIALLGDCCEVTVAWPTDSATQHELRARTFSLNWHPWGPETVLASHPRIDGPVRFVADLDLAGNGRVAWANPQGVLWTQRFDRQLMSVGLTMPAIASQPADADSPLWLALAHEGEYSLAWRRTQGPFQQNILARFDLHGELQQERPLFGDPWQAPVALRAVAADADGDLVLGWHRAAPWEPEQRLQVGRFGGPPNVFSQVGGDPAQSVVEAASSFAYQPRVQNLTAYPSWITDLGILTGVHFEIALDPTLTIEDLLPEPGWTCAQVDHVVTCNGQRVERGASIAPVTLFLRAPKTGPLTNQFAMTQLETGHMPELQQGQQTLIVGDATPDPFGFPNATGVPRNGVAESTTIVPTGFDQPVALSVFNGDVSINGAPYTCCWGELQPGDSVRLRHATPSTFSTARTTTLTLGPVQGSFTSVTEAADTTPDAFALVDLVKQATNVVVISAPVTVTGINSAAPVSVWSGSYSINGGPFRTAMAQVVAGDQVRVRVTTAVSANTTVSATLTIGGVSDQFSATTGNDDTTPDPFLFADVTEARRQRVVETEPVVIGGVNQLVAISVAGNGAEYAINKKAYTTQPGLVGKGDTVRLRMRSSDAPNTRVDTTVTIGGLSDTWSITTGAR